ncbi:MAG: cupin domain-containing protein [Alphaproteobacteria bacterium]
MDPKSFRRHPHPRFRRLGLVLDGEMSVTLADRVVTCRAGDTFSLDANIPHAEQAGGDGVRFLACKK